MDQQLRVETRRRVMSLTIDGADGAAGAAAADRRGVPELRAGQRPDVLLRHPAVANAAVVGVPHPQWGEGIAAFVVLKPGVECAGAVLQQHCREHLAGFEVPKHVALIDKMPTTSTGKIQKHVLRGANQELFS